jgi:hypothetical protein
MEHKIELPTVDPVWARVTSVAIAMFFISFSDAILSYWVPGFMQNALGSALLMGLVMSFSSIVGLAADIVFPQLLANISVRKLESMQR